MGDDDDGGGGGDDDDHLREFPCDTHVILASGACRGGVRSTLRYVTSARTNPALRNCGFGVPEHVPETSPNETF